MLYTPVENQEVGYGQEDHVDLHVVGPSAETPLAHYEERPHVAQSPADKQNHWTYLDRPPGHGQQRMRSAGTKNKNTSFYCD
ncbi:hypothetical protein ElyMa_006680700 [Elysia marginata]|uniref:Uncharacterized protein n=1 Tax=Elysia marginata TaxID=1093978 RepID=A0AAV4ISS1_9GAST|nr:hypothetical protein ElyMa_006680700 [Elysia marginata]